MRAVLYDAAPYTEEAGGMPDKEYYNVFVQHSRQFNSFADSLLGTRLSDKETAIIQRVQNGHAWFAEAIRRSTFGIGRRADNATDEQVRSDTLDVLHAQLEHFIQTNQTEINHSMSSIGESMIRSANVAWLLMAGALLLAIVAAVFITRIITKPIRTLIRGTEEISRGMFKPIEVKSHDELAWLAQSINDMSAKLESID